MIMVNKASKMHLPIAPRYFTSMVCDTTFDVNYIDNAPGAAPTGFFDLSLNEFPTPWNLSGTFSGVSSPSNIGPNGNIYEQAYSTAASQLSNAIPAGLEQLFNITNSVSNLTLYNACRVHAVGISARCVYLGRTISGGGPTQGTLQFGFHPYLAVPQSGASAGSYAATTVNRLVDTPMSRSIIVGEVVASNRQNTCKGFYKIRNIIGCSKKALEYDLSNSTSNYINSSGSIIPPQQMATRLRCLWAASGGVLAAMEKVSLQLNVKLTYYVEFFNAAGNSIVKDF